MSQYPVPFVDRIAVNKAQEVRRAMQENVFEAREARIRARLRLSAEDDDEVVSIDHRSFMHEAFSVFNELRRTGTLCDIVIHVDGRRLSAHRVVLAGRIPYFKAMFSTDMMEARLPEVHIYEMDYETMETLIDYAYTGKLRLSLLNVQNLMLGANFLRIISVVDEGASFLRRRLCPQNAVAVHLFCNSLGYPGIQQATLRFIQKHFVLVSSTPDFLEIDLDEIVSFLQMDELYVDGEEQVFEAAMRWINFDEENRRATAPRLLSCVRLPLLRPSFLSDFVAGNLILKADIQCRDLVDEAKDYHLMPERRAKLTSFRTRPRVAHDVPGLIFAIGGLANYARQERSLVEVFDPVTDAWTSSRPMSSIRSRIGIAVHDRKIYALGGFDGSQRLSIAEYFDTIKNEWFPMTPLLKKRSAMSTAFLDGKLFVCGGYDGISSLSCVESYDVKKECWTEEASMSKQRSASGVAVMDGYVYVLGGHDGMSIFSSCEKFSLETGKWETVPNMLTKRCRLGAATFRGKIYVAGGYDGSQFLSSVECYDLETNTWSVSSPMNIRRCRASLAATNGALYAVGGFDGINNLSSCEVFNPSTDSWDLCSPLRDHAGGVSVGVVPIPADMLETASALRLGD